MNDTSTRTATDRRTTVVAVVSLVLLIAAAAFLALRYDSYMVRSTAMSASLEPDQQVVEEDVSPGDVQRGDVLSFRGGAWDGDPPGAVYAMRVIGLPGDKVEVAADGRLTVNGKEIVEDYVEGDRGEPFASTVAPGGYFMMGDNRAVARDSRARLGTPTGGTIDAGLIEGRLLAVGWPTWKFASLTPGDAFRVAGPSGDAYNMVPIIGAAVIGLAGGVLFVVAIGGSLTRRYRRQG